MPTLAPRRAIAPVVHPGLQRCPEAAIPTPALTSRRRPDLPPWVPCSSPPGPESSARVVRERPANRRQSLCRALTHSRPQEESGFRHRTRPVVCRKTIWCRYWRGEVSQIALRTLEIVDQFLFAEVKGIHTIIGQMAEEIWPWHAGKLGGGTRPISYSLTAAAIRILAARISGVAFKASRISSGMENVTWLIGGRRSHSTAV